MTFKELYVRYQVDMARVDELMHTAVKSNNDDLSQTARQLMDAGGKRIRPMIALVCSRIGNEGISQKTIALAAALEMIHMATLVHDDVIDDASMRRGQPTVREKFGDKPAMYCGDFLFARAISLLSSVDNRDVHRIMSEAIVSIVEGEIDQLGDFYNWNQNLRRYLRRIERKTARLISVSCSLGALVGGADRTTSIRLGRFGYYTGMAFQITDDILDYVGEESTVGKPVGGDLRQGNLTLPALRAQAVGEDGASLRRLVKEGMGDTDLSLALDIVNRSDGIPFAKNLAGRYMAKALQVLTYIDDEKVCTELTQLAKILNERMY